MTDIVEDLRSTKLLLNCAANEIERLRADKAVISQTASDYLHEIERLRVENERLANGGYPGQSFADIREGLKRGASVG